jgi:Alcohol dehydrogenase GroES-like domain
VSTKGAPHVSYGLVAHHLSDHVVRPRALLPAGLLCSLNMPRHRPRQHPQQHFGVFTARAFRAILLVDRARRRKRMNATTNATMKAIVYSRYGSPDVLQLAEVEKPVPKDDELLIKVRAVSVNRSDWEGLTGKPLYARIGGLLKPRGQILGSDIAGHVEMAGRTIRQFQPGDDVLGTSRGTVVVLPSMSVLVNIPWRSNQPG